MGFDSIEIYLVVAYLGSLKNSLNFLENRRNIIETLLKHWSLRRSLMTHYGASLTSEDGIILIYQNQSNYIVCSLCLEPSENVGLGDWS